MDVFRIHGDNIIECERIVELIVAEVKPQKIVKELISPSTIMVLIDFEYLGAGYSWKLELLPGFNKSGRNRWEKDIFKILRENGSFLDETPDAIITAINNQKETVLCSIEFCSALQAGNQAWQRNGRAFSTGRTGCPYLYIVEFVKYELDPKTRQRKALRFPNAAVPYSYICYSKNSDGFVAQVYVKSEEFDKTHEQSLFDFDETNFAENELKAFIVKKMIGLSTIAEEKAIIDKNMKVVMFLSNGKNAKQNMISSQWEKLYCDGNNIIEYSKANSKFVFHKKITNKSHHGKSKMVLSMIDKYSVGLASKDFPVGIIPSNKRLSFSKSLKEIYPNYSDEVIEKIGASDKKDLLLCIIKGFKPKGDDNRPDRGILPLTMMLSNDNADIMTYIYGPIIQSSYNELLNQPKQLAAHNGFWKAVLSESDFVALDVPILRGQLKDAEILIDNTKLKEEYLKKVSKNKLESDVFSSNPQEYHEDDVDTGIHYLFTSVLDKWCFEGMCNPPGGDWSGFSVIHNNFEKRWLSLPRVSEAIDGKRPDHIIEIFDVFKKPTLLSIESKEKSSDLESSVGNGLINYIQHLMNYVPNVEHNKEYKGNWIRSTSVVPTSDYVMISAAAYLKFSAQQSKIVFQNSNCDMLFIMDPIDKGWKINIVTNTEKAAVLKEFIQSKVAASGNKQIKIF